MNLFETYRIHVQALIAALQAEGELPADLSMARVAMEPPRDPAHGDLACNAAMVLARDAAMKPRDLAERLLPRLRALPGVEGVEVAGPGFLNMRLESTVFHDILRAAIREGERFGHSDTGQGTAVNVEYVSANPTGPMHVGHARGAIFGDALCNLLAATGYAVTREYYINDAGAQVDVLARSAFHRYREALGEDLGPVPEGLYPGDYLVPVGQALAAAHGPSLRDLPEGQWLPIVRQHAIDAMMAMIREDLAALGIVHDVFSSEKALHVGSPSPVEATLAALARRDLVYQGRLPPPKGAPAEDWEDREQTLFRASAFGDDTDRPLRKSDGSYTYFASDIAYHADKLARGFSWMIDVLGADHGGYVKRMTAAVAAVSEGKARLDCEICQLVKLLRDGQEVKMSKRAGVFITLREVVDEVGRDACRFMMLFRKNDATLEFDLAKVIEQTRDNPVFYVQYAHARSMSVFRQAAVTMPDLPLTTDALAEAAFTRLTDAAEVALIRAIAAYPRVIEQAAHAREPHRVAFHLHDVAGLFHAWWNRGKDDAGLRFLNDTDRDLTVSRLGLVSATRSTLASGLGLLGVTAPHDMR